jgi:L-rhamnose mutarotase
VTKRRLLCGVKIRRNAFRARHGASCRASELDPTGKSGGDRGVFIKAFKMAVHPAAHAEYQRRHNPIWKELEDVLIAHGVRTYSIFLDAATSELFAYAEIESEDRWQAIASTDVCQRWWQHMRDLMPTNADGSPKSTELREVFRLGTPLD